MKAVTAIGIAASCVSLLVAVVLEGGNPMALFNVPALLIVVGGTFGVVMASTEFSSAMAMPKLMARSFKGCEVDCADAARQMVALAEKARREGLLALESEIAGIEDAYARKGVQLVVDGADPELARAILQAEIDGMAQRHAANAHLFMTAGGFAPTLGILGTVLSLVHVLENLSSPASLGHSIAGAFLATLYGVGTANVVYIPVANKLKEMTKQELNYRELLLEGILSIQAGENPRLLAEKLETFVPPHERGAGESATSAGAKVAPSPALEAA